MQFDDVVLELTDINVGQFDQDIDNDSVMVCYIV